VIEKKKNLMTSEKNDTRSRPVLFQCHCHWMLYNKYYMAAIVGQWDKTFIKASQQGNACAITSLEAGLKWFVFAGDGDRISFN